jgi:uncharacterized protein YjbI with pentapeptide repeats
VAVGSSPPSAPDPNNKSEKRSSSVPLWLVVSAIIAVAGVVEVVIYGYLETPGWIGVADKKFWDYLELLIVPAALAIGVYLLNRAQSEREREAEEARREHELDVENQRAQDAALQAYLDQMSQLLTDKDRPLHRAQVGDHLSTVARARTLTVLRRLDSERKGRVLQFLYESGLIAKDRRVLDLLGADLSEAHLSGADLGKPYKAYLGGANLKRAYLIGVYLRGADLNEGVLIEANLSGAALRGANLNKANLSGANLSEAKLAYASLIEAKLSRADLREANVWHVNLSRADLRGANLVGAALNGADLSSANLTGAKGVTEEQLEEQAKTLEGATMPNGSIHP